MVYTCFSLHLTQYFMSEYIHCLYTDNPTLADSSFSHLEPQCLHLVWIKFFVFADIYLTTPVLITRILSALVLHFANLACKAVCLLQQNNSPLACRLIFLNIFYNRDTPPVISRLLLIFPPFFKLVIFTQLSVLSEGLVLWLNVIWTV